MKQRSFRTLFWALALVGTTLDQVTKYAVFRWLYSSEGTKTYEVWPGVFQFVATYTGEREPGTSLFSPLRTLSGEGVPLVNHGALFGLGGGYSGAANLVFAIVSVAAAVAIIAWTFRKATARDAALCAALGLILAGTLGNLYDRLIFGGVRDFLHFYWIEWPVFNVADCCLVLGACVLLAHAFWAPQAEPATQPAQSTAIPLPEMVEVK